MLIDSLSFGVPVDAGDETIDQLTIAARSNYDVPYIENQEWIFYGLGLKGLEKEYEREFLDTTAYEDGGGHYWKRSNFYQK